MIRKLITRFALWIVQKCNPYKDRALSQQLYEIAEEYNTRPGENNYYPIG